MRRLENSSLIFVIALSLFISHAYGFYGDACTNNTDCNPDAPLCNGGYCSYCTLNYDCYEHGMYYCNGGNTGKGKCQDCDADYFCQSYFTSKPYCNTTLDNAFCSQCSDSNNCCSSNLQCGSWSLPECDTSTGVCGACTSNSSCQTWSQRYCVRGTCVATYSIGTLDNCLTYDSLGYCTSCNTNYSVSDTGVCVQSCTENANCTESRSLSYCNTTLGYCTACSADTDCSHQGYAACISGRCEACASDSYCTSLSSPYCKTSTYECVECTQNSECSNSTSGSICSIDAGTCQATCPTYQSGIICDSYTEGCQCGSGYTCQSSECRASFKKCFHKSSLVKKLVEGEIQEVEIDQIEVGDVIVSFDFTARESKKDKVLIIIRHEETGKTYAMNLTYKDSNKIERSLVITDNHYLFVVKGENKKGGKIDEKMAREVKVGDYLLDENLNIAKITDIKGIAVNQSDLISIYTSRGLFVINEILGLSKSEDDESDLYMPYLSFLAEYVHIGIPQKISDLIQSTGINQMYKTAKYYFKYYYL